MPVRLRLPLALLACAVATVVVSLALWRLEQGDVRAEADERAHAAASGLEERADAAVLALKGVRAAYDASGSVDAEAFATHARVPLARPEIVAVGWAPRVSAAQRGAVESGEQIRIEAPAGALVTYPLLRQEPAGDSPNVLDLGSDPSLGEALRIARSTGTPQLSAPVRLERNGGLGTFAFVPVFARDLPLDTPRSAATPCSASSSARSRRTSSPRPRSPACREGSTFASPTAPPCSPTGPAARPSRRPRSAAAPGGSR